jgi:hypothetical protein
MRPCHGSCEMLLRDTHYLAWDEVLPPLPVLPSQVDARGPEMGAGLLMVVVTHEEQETAARARARKRDREQDTEYNTV